MIYEVYEIFASDTEIHFQFTTSRNVDYLIKLSKASYRFDTSCLSCSNIYEIAFQPLGIKKTPPDHCISLTIKAFIKQYIIVHNCPILFVCDASDKRQLVRLKLFNKWCNNDEDIDNYLYETREFIFEHYNLYIGIVSSASDNNFSEYLEEIDTMGLG